MKQTKKPQHRVAVFLDPPLYKLVKSAADAEGTAITQFLAHLAAKKFKYEPQMTPRKFKHATAA